MIFKSFYPCVALQEYVSLYRIRHFLIPPNLKDHSKPYPPHPEQCIIFYPRGSEMTGFTGDNFKIIRPRSVLPGQFTRRIDRSSLQNELLLILVAFKPGALHRLTGIPFSLLTNTIIDLESIYPRLAREVNEKLSSCEDYSEMLSIIEKFLINLTVSRKLNSGRIDRVFDVMLKNEKNYSLEWLAREACMSVRQFERKTLEYIGICPKVFGRITRFNQSYYKSMAHPYEGWLNISLECGYHDYQHLVKDYKKFACATPKKFLEEESRSLERALGLT